ncbi:MAG: retropepsin-like domain-containing protein [Planctomycetia bacterium]|nr:retropepsin-like domain-containing protein [Planctomycetia bacterium]
MSIALLLLTGLIGIQQDKPPSADEIMQRVRQAMNFSLEKIPEAGLILEGKYISGSGIRGKIRIHFNRQGHFLQQKDSVLGTTLFGYDGKDVWEKDYDGASDLLEPSKPRLSLLWGVLNSGLWIDKSSGMTFTFAKDLALPDQYLLQFSHELSQLTGTISIDKKSLLPQKCKFTVEGEYWTITWNETLSYEGMKLPRNIEIAIIAAGDTKHSHQWDSATAATKTSDNPFRPQISPPTNVTFDASKTALLEVKKSNSGDLLVRPLVNGQDVGWFLLGSGTAGNVLHVRTAKKLGLDTYGEAELRAVGGKVKAYWSRPKTISLGRMILHDPLVFNKELSEELDDASGVPIAGIIGQGTFRCSVIELDYVTSQVALYDPKTYEQERGKKNWQKLHVSRVLGVEAEFEGHKGVFYLTYIPTNMVSFHSPAVKKMNLLEGRELKDIINRGGELAAKTGKLKYFEIGGHRHEDVAALFHTSETGPSSDHGTIGSIGVELLKPFQIVFDYQNRRIAFVKRDAKVP